jgi:myo-inositol-1(or 4)-monophosphatase
MDNKTIEKYAKLRLEVASLACSVGNWLRDARTGASAQVEVKGLNDFVTQYDKLTEEKLVAGLEDLLPGAGFIAEEQTSTYISSDYNWIIDPIDGTTNFIHGLPVYAISIGLSFRGQIVLGVVYEIGASECFSASAGGGAYLGSSPIKVSGCARVSDALIAAAFPYNNYSRMEPYMLSLSYLVAHSHGQRMLGSAATNLAYVACGRFDAFYEYDLKPWDVAAGSIIVKEAGGAVSDFAGGGGYISGGEIIACAAGIADEFNAIVSGYMNNNK